MIVACPETLVFFPLPESTTAPSIPMKIHTVVYTAVSYTHLDVYKRQEVVCGMDDILTASVDGSGYNDKYGLLGSNKSTEDSIKLLPIHCQVFVDGIQKNLNVLTGKTVEVMVYGDGAFKAPVGKIWEPVSYTHLDVYKRQVYGRRLPRQPERYQRRRLGLYPGLRRT